MNYKDLNNKIHSIEPEFAYMLPNGCVPITDAEAKALQPVPLPPTPIQQIRALEQAYDDDQRKLNRQASIDTALTIASRAPAAAGMTRDQVHAAYYAGNRGYKAMIDLEVQCAALRKLIV